MNYENQLYRIHVDLNTEQRDYCSFCHVVAFGARSSWKFKLLRSVNNTAVQRLYFQKSQDSIITYG
jgi:hypothetical protein